MVNLRVPELGFGQFAIEGCRSAIGYGLFAVRDPELAVVGSLTSI
ncbi:MAG: hypothetical protein ABI355_16890 [Solirubrobacteraceae bacterium]